MILPRSVLNTRDAHGQTAVASAVQDMKITPLLREPIPDRQAPRQDLQVIQPQVAAMDQGKTRKGAVGQAAAHAIGAMVCATAADTAQQELQVQEEPQVIQVLLQEAVQDLIQERWIRLKGAEEPAEVGPEATAKCQILPQVEVIQEAVVPLVGLQVHRADLPRFQQLNNKANPFLLLLRISKASQLLLPQ